MILLIVISNEEAQTFKDHFSFGQKQIYGLLELNYGHFEYQASGEGQESMKCIRFRGMIEVEE